MIKIILCFAVERLGELIPAIGVVAGAVRDRDLDLWPFGDRLAGLIPNDAGSAIDLLWILDQALILEGVSVAIKHGLIHRIGADPVSGAIAHQPGQGIPLM